MKKTGILHSLPFKLLVALAVGIVAGLALNAVDGTAIGTALLNIIVTVKYIAGQFISFCVPLIIIGFIAPSITRLGNNASRMLIVALCIAYISSIGAAFFATGAGFTILPHLNISPEVDGLKVLPPVVFELSIPQIMPVMSALFLSVMVGLAAAWNSSKLITGLLEEFQKIVLSIVTKMVIPVLPILIGCTFCTLADRTLHLAGASVWYRRCLFRKESTQYHQELWTGLYDSGRNHVQRGNPFGCTGMREEVRADTAR